MRCHTVAIVRRAFPRLRGATCAGGCRCCLVDGHMTGWGAAVLQVSARQGEWPSKERNGEKRMRTSEFMAMDAAQAYAMRGWRVLPLHGVDTETGHCSCGDASCRRQGKHPAVQRGVHVASANPATLASWRKAFPGANIAIATGGLSRVVVLDVDVTAGKAGFDTLQQLQKEHGELPPTVTAISGSGGQHFYFQVPNRPVPTSYALAGWRRMKDIDLLSDGAYVVAPPSLHVCGERYRWMMGHSPEEIELAPLPGWLCTPDEDSEAEAVLAEHDLACASHRIPQGQRTATLTGLAVQLWATGISYDGLKAALGAENTGYCDPPLDELELQKIVTLVASNRRP